MSDTTQQPRSDQEGPESGLDSGRRETLERLGKYAAPVLLAMLLAPKGAQAGQATSAD